MRSSFKSSFEVRVSSLANHVVAVLAVAQLEARPFLVAAAEILNDLSDPPVTCTHDLL